MATIDDILNGTFSQLGYGGAPAATGGSRGVSINGGMPPAPTGGSPAPSPYLTPAEKQRFLQETGVMNGMMGRGLPATGQASGSPAPRTGGIYPAWISMALADRFNATHPDSNVPRPPPVGAPVLNAPGYDPWRGLRGPGRQNGGPHVPGVSLGHMGAVASSPIPRPAGFTGGHMNAAQSAAVASGFGGGQHVINSNGNYFDGNEWHYSDPAHSGFTPRNSTSSLV